MRSIKRIALACSVGFLLAPVAWAENWKVAKEEDGIKVSLSDVPGSKYKAYQGVTLIKAPLAKVKALQEDAAGACKWIFRCESLSLLKHEGNQSWSYTQIETPFPADPRDSIVHVTEQPQPDGSLIRKLEGVADYQPERKGYVRVASLEGFWKLVPKGDSTEVIYQVHTDPGGSVPAMIINKFVVDAPFETLKGLRAAAEQR